MRLIRLAIVLVALAALLRCTGENQRQRTFLAQEEKKTEAKTQSKGQGPDNSLEQSYNCSENQTDIDTPRYILATEVPGSNGTISLAMPMQMGQRTAHRVVQEVPEALQHGRLLQSREIQVSFSAQRSECADEVRRCKEGQDCRKARSTYAFPGRTKWKCKWKQTGDNNSVDQHHPSGTASFAESRASRKDREGRQGARGRKDKKAGGHIKGGAGSTTLRRGQTGIGQSSTTGERTTTQTRPHYTCGAYKKGIRHSEGNSPEDGQGMARIHRPADEEIQQPNEGLQHSPITSIRGYDGEEEALGGGKGSNTASCHGSKGRTRGASNDDSRGNEGSRRSTEEVGSAHCTNSHQCRRRRGRDVRRRGGASRDREVCRGSALQDKKEGERQGMQIDAKLAGELIEWNGTAPLQFFKAATDPIGRPEIHRDFYEPELVKRAWQKSKLYLVSTVVFMLTAMARIVCYGGPTCCRRMKKAGIRRIQQRVQIHRKMHYWKLKHLLCRYLLIWHFLGAEAMGGYQGKEASLSRTEESSQILREEENLQMNIQPTFGSRHAAIVIWTHPGEYRFSRRGIGHAIVIDKHRSHTEQIRRDFQEFEDMEDRRWTRSERKIQWGSVGRFHWMIHNGPRTPIWAYIHENERSILWTMLLEESHQQWTVSDLFEQIMPEHQCRQEAECHINGKTWDQVVQISPGSVLDMTHTIPRSEEEDNRTPSTTTCSEAMQSYSSAPSRAQEDDDSSSFHQLKNANKNQQDTTRQKRGPNEERRDYEERNVQQQFEEEQQGEEEQRRCSTLDGYRQQEDLRVVQQLIQEAEREWEDLQEYTDDHTEVNNRQELQNEIAALRQGEDANLHLVMHGLSTQSIGTREKHVDPSRIPMIIDLLIAIREAWRDQLRAHGMMTVSYVKPQPRVTTVYGTQCIHLVIDVEPWIFGTPNLLVTSHRYAILDAGVHIMKAYRETQRVSTWSVMATSNTIETCQDEHNLCNFWAGGSLLDQHEIASYPGMLVSVDIAYGLWQWNIEQEMDQALEVPTQPEEEIQMEGQDEGDETMWTQVRLRSASRSPPPSHSRRQGTSRFREAHIFEENRGIPDKIPMNQVPQDMVREHIEEQIRHQRGDTTTTRAELFEIHPNPPTIINKNAIGFIWRPLTQQQMQKVIILLDIDVIPYGTIPNVEAVSYRNAIHVRQSSTRAEMLQEVGLEAMGHEEECVVVTRGSLWDEDDVSTRHHENGDYFLISAAHKPQRRSPREVLMDLIEWQNNRETGCDRRTARRRIERPENESDNSDLLQTSASPQRTQRQVTREEKERWQEQEGDTFSGMATNRAARRHTHARVYTMDDEEHQIIVPIPRIPESQFRAHIYVTVTEGYTAQQRAAFCLHQVVPNPDDRENKKEKAYILEDDTQRSQEMIPILLDVNVVTNQPRGMGPTDEWRETKYISQRLTRRQFINEVQLGPWCNRGTCVIQMGGRLWRTNDADTWALFPGIYAIVTVLNEQCDTPFHIQWRRYNGPHQDAERSHTSSSPSESSQGGGNREQGESSPSQVMGSDPESDMNDLMQRTVWKVPRRSQMQHHVHMRRTSAAKAAAVKLPPPGNGVRFQQCTTIIQDECRTLVNDCSMTNRYIEEFCTTRDGCDNRTFKAFIHECRFQQVQSEKQDQEGNNKENSDEEDLSIKKAYLPIRAESSAGDATEQASRGRGRQKLNLYQCLYGVCRDANPGGSSENNGRMSKQKRMEECINNMRGDPRAKYVLSNRWDEIPQLHHTTRHALAQTLVRTQGELQCVHIYVDGSRTKMELHGQWWWNWKHAAMDPTDITLWDTLEPKLRWTQMIRSTLGKTKKLQFKQRQLQ